MNQSELATRVKCHRSQVCRILSGKRNASRDLAQRLCEAVQGTTLIDWLFARQNTRKLAAAVRRAK